jgi:decaprenylphospho-beta-D-erythro-pentofuranosid-2-ulose 2-reductase
VSKTVLVLGATSAIAIAYCRLRANEGSSFFLVGRQEERLATIAADLKARGARDAVPIVADLSDMDDCENRFAAFCQPLGQPDEVLLAYGMLGEQSVAGTSAEETRRIIDVNFTSQALWLQMAAKHLADDKERSIIVIGSVAGDRGRGSNYVYGSAKAGIAAFAQGLGHRLHGTKINVLLVKPGFVDTPMTSHLDRSSPLWATPDRVAADIDKAVRKRKAVVYTPWFWRIIMTVISLLPHSIFRRTKL